MKLLVILSTVVLLATNGSMYAGGDSPKVACDSCPPEEGCIGATDFYVTETPLDGGQSLFELHLKFVIDPESDFMRVYYADAAGATFSYPFRDEWQIVPVVAYSWETEVHVYGNVYNVLPNGKVISCATDGYLPLQGEGGPEKMRWISTGEPGKTVVSDVTVYPNPASDAAQIQVTVPSNDPTSSIDIIDMNGIVVATVTHGLAQGLSVVPADVANLPIGAYTVRMLHAAGAVVTPLRVVR